jgi:NAD(P)-dependent dehydrogenase (short-subunit alcohol dehydrogenase family)
MSAPRDDGPVLITGCSSGLGLAGAIAFQRAGYLTVTTALDAVTSREMPHREPLNQGRP